MPKRCPFVDLKDVEYIAYHDNEWGKPLHIESKLFEALILEIFSAGLSWQCILHKRKAFQKAFDDFDIEKIACYDAKKIETLLNNKEIVRHLNKIKATIQNAKVFLKIQKQWGSFNDYIWHFVENKPLKINYQLTENKLSALITGDLKKQGMVFLGSTTIFAYLCAIGIFNAHAKDCFLYEK